MLVFDNDDAFFLLGARRSKSIRGEAQLVDYLMECSRRFMRIVQSISSRGDDYQGYTIVVSIGRGIYRILSVWMIIRGIPLQ